MPVNWSNYPGNWKQLSRSIKESAGWTCQECQKPCRKPGLAWDRFYNALSQEWREKAIDTVKGVIKVRKQRFTLTVAHLDHNTRNNDLSNLRALCATCHLKYDAKHHAETRRKKADFQQMVIPLPNRLDAMDDNCLD